MNNTPKLLCSWSLDAATKRNSRASMLSKAVPVAVGLLCLFSLPAFAAEDASETNPPSVTDPPSPPPASGARSSGTSPPNPVAFDPSMKLTPEEGKEYWDRYVTGDWWGLRTRLHNYGVDFNLDYFSEMATNFSGGKDNFN